MRIAYFHPKFSEVGGAELLGLQHVELLRAAGVEVEVVTFEVAGGAWESAFRDLKVHVVPKRGWPDLFAGWTRAGKLRCRARRALPILGRFDRVLATNHPCCTMLDQLRLPGGKLWYCHEPFRNLFPRETQPYCAAALARLGPATPALAAFQRKVQELARREHGYAGLRRLNIRAIAGMDRCFFNSRFSLGTARAAYGEALKGEVIYPMVAFPASRPPRRGLDRAALRILVQARLTAMKNLETVIDGFKRFRQAHPGAELHILGSGPDQAALEARAATGPGGGGATFHGFLPQAEVDALRARCDVFALLPLDEPFGMVYPEAAAAGLLLVGPDHGGPREILDDGRLGWVCDALSAAAFADALEAICATPDAELDQRREETACSCRERFSIEVLGPRLVERVTGTW